MHISHTCELVLDVISTTEMVSFPKYLGLKKCIRMWSVETIFLVNSLGLKLFYHRWCNFHTIFYSSVQQKVRIQSAHFISFKHYAIICVSCIYFQYDQHAIV